MAFEFSIYVHVVCWVGWSLCFSDLVEVEYEVVTQERLVEHSGIMADMSGVGSASRTLTASGQRDRLNLMFCAVPGHDIVSCRVLTSPLDGKDTCKPDVVSHQAAAILRCPRLMRDSVLAPAAKELSSRRVLTLLERIMQLTADIRELRSDGPLSLLRRRTMPKAFQECYEKIKLLGEGAFGAAYLVKPKGRRENALQVAKEIRVSHLTAKQQEGALAESEVLRMLEHPNIIAYIDSFSEGSRMYIVMEYADGGDLAIKIKDRKEASTSFEEREIMFIFVQLALALIYIHSRKVLHRDLKPLNIFLTKQGIVKLGDFGISRVLDSSTAGAQTTIGTPHYLSPEMVNNEAYGTRSDLWSLGVVTYELAALRVPFAGSSLPAVAMKIMGADPDPLPEKYSQDLVWIVMGLLSKDPSQRPRLEAVQRMPYVQKYMQVLLSYSRQTGAGGCEAMTGMQKRARIEPELQPSQRPAPTPQSQGGNSPLSPSRQKAAHAEFVRTRQAALEVKRRIEGEAPAATKAGERRPRQREEPEEPGPAQLSGKEREAEVKRRAQMMRHELEAQRWSELNLAMKANQEEKRRLLLRREEANSEDSMPTEPKTRPQGGVEFQQDEAAGDSSPSGRPRSSKDKQEEEAIYLRQFEQAILEQAKERKRLVQLAAKRTEDRSDFADAEISAGSGDEVDSDKENVMKRLPLRRQAAEKIDTSAAYQRGGDAPAPMVLEIPFTDKVKPKPKLSSDSRGSKRSTALDAPGDDMTRGRRPPAAPSRPEGKEQRLLQ
eukprot:s134_g9.t1